MGHRKMSIKDAHISPQATTLVVIEYGLYVLHCYHVKCLIHDVCSALIGVNQKGTHKHMLITMSISASCLICCTERND